MIKINYKAYIAEFIGTMLLTFFGCASACIVGTKVDGGYLIVALTFGLVLTSLCYTIGSVSGCHVNPAVTIAMLINKTISVFDAVCYIVSQFVGGLAGGALLSFFFKEEYGLGSNDLVKTTILDKDLAGKDLELTIIIELILTFTFVLTVLGATSKKEHSSVSGIVIGAALTLVHIIGIHYTGTSVNPARSFGPAFFAKEAYLSNVWVFIVAPIAGAVLAALVWQIFKVKKNNLK